MKEIFFIVNDTIVGKQRPRFVRRGNFVSTYTPKKTQSFEDSVAEAYRFNYPAGMSFPDEALEIRMEFIFKMPSSWSKKKQQEMLWKPCKKKPDIDNCMKSIMDALNGVAYTDDSQITDVGKITKCWGFEESVAVEIKEVK